MLKTTDICECGWKPKVCGDGHCRKHHTTFLLVNHDGFGCHQCRIEKMSEEMVTVEQLQAKNAALERKLEWAEVTNRQVQEMVCPTALAPTPKCAALEAENKRLRTTAQAVVAAADRGDTDEIYRNMRGLRAALKGAGDYYPVELERYRKALQDIAKQWLEDEMTEEDRDGGDFQGAYDCIVKVARAALAGKEG